MPFRKRRRPDPRPGSPHCVPARPLQLALFGQHEAQVARAFYEAGTLVHGAARPKRHDHLVPAEGGGVDGGSGEQQSTESVGNSALGRSEHEEASAPAMNAPDEEVREVRSIKAPPVPTQEEVFLRRTSHLPYRCWWLECVEAFAREWGHRKQETSWCIPNVSCDYLYIIKNGLFAREELSDDERQASA